MAKRLPYMSKGSWIIVGVIVACAFLIQLYAYHFRPADLFEGQELGKVNEATLRTNMLAFNVSLFVVKCMGAAFGALLIAFIYTAVRLRRLEDRIAHMEQQGYMGEEPSVAAPSGGTTG